MALIEDGTGSGYSASVDNENRLQVKAVTQTLHSHVSEEEAESYIWTATQTLGADKCLIWLRNNNTDTSLIIQKIIISPAAACQFEIWVGSNVTTEAGSAVT
jgi:hypothetical protein